jgi:hypothetical protein
MRDLFLAFGVFKCEWNTLGCNREVVEVGYFFGSGPFKG